MQGKVGGGEEGGLKTEVGGKEKKQETRKFLNTTSQNTINCISPKQEGNPVESHS